MFDGGRTHGGIARAVGKEKSVIVHLREIVIPGDTDYLYLPGDQAAEDIVLDPAVDKDDPLRPFPVVKDFMAADGGDQEIPSSVSDLVGMTKEVFSSFLFHKDPAGHGSFFPEHAGEGARVDAGNARNPLFAKPGTETFDGIPVAVIHAVIGNYQALDVDPSRLCMEGQPVGADAHVGDTVISYQRITYTENLSLEGRVGQAFGVADHRGGEHDFTRGRTVCPETPSFEPAAVAKE
jgi:hypothetical protein